jgi:uncharacterized membrane protein
MRKKKNVNVISTLLILCIISIVIITSCTKSTEPTEVVFTALPYAGVDFAYGFAEGINSTGTIVLGGSAVNTPDDKYFEIPPVYWTEDVVTILPFPIDQVPGFERQCAVYDMSNTGIMVGTQAIADLTPLAYYYSGNQWHAIIDPATSAQAQTVSGISGDGNLMVGLSANARENQGGYYYNVATGEFTILASTFEDSAQYTNAQTSLFDISGDGLIMVGSDGAEKYDSIGVQLPIYFDMAKDTLPTRLPLPSGYIDGLARGISNDGSTIVGTIYDDDATPYAAYWDDLRQVHLLGTFSPYPGPMQPASIALAASDNGDRIVGTSYDIAFIKFKNDAMFSLQEWLEDEGLASELADWDLLAATGITPDGHWIVGVGRDGVYTRAFKVYIP